MLVLLFTLLLRCVVKLEKANFSNTKLKFITRFLSFKYNNYLQTHD